MGVPKKSLRKSNLTIESAVDGGSHKNYRVKFIENGVELKGYFKEISEEDHYPELLAKFSVAVSVIKHTFQGNRSARELLVFDDDEKLVGTVSVSFDDFKRLNFAEEKIASLAEKEFVVPSTNTLIEKNFIEILFGRWFLSDDDTHPGNIGTASVATGAHLDAAGNVVIDIENVAVDIDFDMFFIWFIVLMKGKRWMVDPAEDINLTVDNYETFPCLDKTDPRFHFPTNESPGADSLPKLFPLQEKALYYCLRKPYADPAQFINLSKDPRAHEQKFIAGMKILLAHQPSMLEARLRAHFGDLTFNFTSLKDSVSNQYKERFKEFCNDNTDSMPFVDFIMKFYQRYYDSLYRIIVLSTGCQDNGFKVTLEPTWNNLYLRPSVYKNIRAWMLAQNLLLQHDPVQNVLLADGKQSILYNEEELQQRYHSIWRDAYAPVVRELCVQSYNFVNELLDTATCKNFRSNLSKGKQPADDASTEAKNEEESLVDGKQPIDSLLTVLSEQGEASAINSKPVTDHTLTKVMEYIGKLPELKVSELESVISINKDTDWAIALKMSAEFTNSLKHLVETYYSISREELTEKHNDDFVGQLQMLYRQYYIAIPKKLGNESSAAKKFGIIAEGLDKVVKKIDFSLHLLKDDELMKLSTAEATSLASPTDPAVLALFNQNLFHWAAELPSEQFTRYIKDIVNKHYKPNFSSLSNRFRAPSVLSFLDLSQNAAGDYRLAYILSSGSEETGALNRLLIEHLTPLMLEKYPKKEIKDGHLEHIHSYTISAVQHAVKQFDKEPRLGEPSGTGLFCSIFYDWVRKLDKWRFDQIIEESLLKYELDLSRWSVSRRKEVKDYCANNSQDKAVALTIVKGKESSTCSTALCEKIIAGITADIKSGKIDIHESPDYRVFMQYEGTDMSWLFNELKRASIRVTHGQKSESGALVFFGSSGPSNTVNPYLSGAMSAPSLFKPG